MQDSVAISVIESNGRVLDEMKIIWKQVGVTWSTYCPGIRMDGLRNIRKYRSFGRDSNRGKGKVKFSLWQAVEALSVARGWGSHIFRHSAHRWRWGCQSYAPSYPCDRSWRPIELWDVEAPTVSRSRLTVGGEVSPTREAVPVTGRGGPYDRETSRLPHCHRWRWSC
jgi:hypothetical protein